MPLLCWYKYLIKKATPLCDFFVFSCHPGAIFPLASETKYLPSDRITIPKAFYKVIYDLTPPVKMIGFIIPHCSSDQPLQVFAVSVDEVEKQTELDFFSKLPDDLEERLERIFTVNF